MFHLREVTRSLEEIVLSQDIVYVGGGSMRKVGGEQSPQTVALELLGDIAQPALRDVKVEFQGIKAARVYPEALAMRQRLFPSDHPDVARNLHTLAELLEARADLAACEPMYRDAVRMYRALGDAMHGPIHALALKTYTPEAWAKVQSR